MPRMGIGRLRGRLRGHDVPGMWVCRGRFRRGHVVASMGIGRRGLRTVMLVGVVRDTGGRTLSGAEIRAGAGHTTLSDAEGRFAIMGVPADTVQLLVRRIGYLPADVILAADPGARVELAVNLVPSAVELGTIVIEGRQLSTHLHRNGFYDRQRRSFGKLFGPEEIERSATPLTGFLYQVPNVRIRRERGGAAVAYGSAGAGRQCPLNVYLDGILIRWAGEAGLDNIINRQDILAIEVYPRATLLPSSLGRTGQGTSSVGGLGSPGGGAGLSGVSTSDCGALVIWTKPIGG